MEFGGFPRGASSLLDVHVGVEVDADGPDMSAAQFASFLDTMDPGPATMGFLGGLDPLRLGEAGRYALLQAWRRCEAWVAAAMQPVIVAVATPTWPWIKNADWLREDVGLALRLSPWAAEQRIGVAGALTTAFAGTWAGLEFVDISYRTRSRSPNCATGWTRSGSS
jgi:hypothetical protein